MANYSQKAEATLAVSSTGSGPTPPRGMSRTAAPDLLKLIASASLGFDGRNARPPEGKRDAEVGRANTTAARNGRSFILAMVRRLDFEQACQAGEILFFGPVCHPVRPEGPEARNDSTSCACFPRIRRVVESRRQRTTENMGRRDTPKRRRRAISLAAFALTIHASPLPSTLAFTCGPDQIQSRHVLPTSSVPTTATRLHVQLPTQNEQERALNDLLLQIAVQNGDDEEVLQRERERRLAEQSDRDGGEEDLAVLQPALAFAGGTSLIIMAAFGAYALSNGLLSVGAGPAG